MNEPETCFESGGEEPCSGSQPWTMEYVARLFMEGGGFEGIANTHNAALERAKSFNTRFLPSHRRFDHIAA